MAVGLGLGGDTVEVATYCLHDVQSCRHEKAGRRDPVHSFAASRERWTGAAQEGGKEQVQPESNNPGELIAATTGVRKRADFHDLAGHWMPDPAFDEIMATQRQIDPDK